jgi:hypothetical protein
MLHHLQTRHHREATKARRQVVVGRAFFKLERRILRVGLGDALSGWVHTGHAPPLLRQHVRHAAVAAAEFKHSPPPPRSIRWPKPRHLIQQSRQEVVMCAGEYGAVPAIPVDFVIVFHEFISSNRRSRTGTAGLPRATIQGGKSLNTLERAVTTAPSPIVTPGPTNTSAVIHTRSPIVDGCSHQRHCRKGVVMACRAKKAVLADGGMRTYADFGHAVAIHAFAQASVVAHLKVPRCPDAGGRIRVHRLAKFGAEEPKQQAAPRMQHTRASACIRAARRFARRCGQACCPRESCADRRSNWVIC